MRRPSGAKAGSDAFSPTIGRRERVPPDTVTRHKAELRPRSDEKTRERPSRDQARATALRLSSVMRVARPPKVGATNTSETPLEITRRNARDLPSGEKAGLV